MALPAQYLRLGVHNLQVVTMAADALPHGQEALGFPTGLYLALGGQLPGF